MCVNQSKTDSTSRSIPTSVIAWVVVLLVSELPNAIWQAVIGPPPSWFFWAKVGFLIVMAVFGWTWKRVKPLRFYFIPLLALNLALWTMNWIRATPNYLQWEEQVG